MKLFLRQETHTLQDRLIQGTNLVQIIMGPRQVGKTTAIRQTLDALAKKGFAGIFAGADAIAAPPAAWILENWEKADALAKSGKRVILAFDEVQKIPGWAEIVKARLESDAIKPAAKRPLIILSGSSTLMIEKGLTESLAGRYELLRFHHWGLAEMSEAFGTSPDEYLRSGGYPRLSEFGRQPDRFLEYIKDSIIEPVLNKDILLLHPVTKPALLRRLFEFSAYHCAEIVSLQKMLGQLTDKGNVTTIANYLDLLSKAFLAVPIQKYSPEILRIRASSPKLIVPAQALISAIRNILPPDLTTDRELYGRLAENAVGAHILKSGVELYYWRERDKEIDFIAKKGKKTIAIEVGISKDKDAYHLKKLAAELGIEKNMIIGPAGIPIAKFLSTAFSL